MMVKIKMTKKSVIYNLCKNKSPHSELSRSMSQRFKSNNESFLSYPACSEI